jgi:hypothetical protein
MCTASFTKAVEFIEAYWKDVEASSFMVDFDPELSSVYVERPKKTEVGRKCNALFWKSIHVVCWSF